MTTPEDEQGLRLILMRHTKSAWDTPLLTDHARPLNGRGRRSARALGRWLDARGHRPDEALVSDAMRTQETFARLGLDLGRAVDVDFDPGLYLAEPPALLARLRESSGARVLLVAHNPGIGAFAHALVATPPDHPRFADYPTGATLVVEFPIAHWDQLRPGTGRVLDFAVPRELTE